MLHSFLDKKSHIWKTPTKLQIQAQWPPFNKQQNVKGLNKKPFATQLQREISINQNDLAVCGSALRVKKREEARKHPLEKLHGERGREEKTGKKVLKVI